MKKKQSKSPWRKQINGEVQEKKFSVNEIVPTPRMKFRCSSLPQLMTNGRGKTHSLGLTALDVITEMAIEAKYNKRKFVSSPEMEKGTLVETEVLNLWQHENQSFEEYTKKRYENEYLTGEPDYVYNSMTEVLDIKSSFDIWSFTKIDEAKAKKDYYWQLVGYAHLLGINKVSLVYGLVDTPEEIMHDIWRPLAYRVGEEEAEKIVRNNHTVSDIPASKRLKEYSWTIPQKDFDKLTERLIEAQSIYKEVYERV